MPSSGRSSWRWTTIVLLTVALCMVRCNGQEGVAGRGDPAGGAALAPADAQATSQGFDLPGVASEALKGLEPLHKEMAGDGQGQGYIDWSLKKIVAQGRAAQAGNEGADALMAKRGASVIALRNALALSMGVRIGINGQVAGLKNGEVAIQGFLKGFEVKRTRSERGPDGRTYWIAEVDVPLFGIQSVAGTLYDAQLNAHKALVGGMRRGKWAPPAEPAALAGDVLVIDARGLGFAPSMYPLIASRNGQIILDMQTVPKDVAVQVGLCAYATTNLTLKDLQSTPLRPGDFRVVELAAAPGPSDQNVDGMPLDRILLAQAAASTPASAASASQPASHPARPPRRFTVKAVAAEGKDKGTVVIADKESLELLKDPHASGLAQSGRVLVVVDAAAAGMEGRLAPGLPDQAVAFASMLPHRELRK